jgi:hypothetical protein
MRDIKRDIFEIIEKKGKQELLRIFMENAEYAGIEIT